MCVCVCVCVVGFLFWTMCDVTCDGEEEMEEVPLCSQEQVLHYL